MVEIGVFGLIKAARSFDAAKGATFKTYAYTNIKGAIYDELRRIDIVPRKQRDRLREVETAREQLSAELSRQPTLGEIADRLQLPVTELDELLVTQRSCQLLSLDVDGPEQRGLLDTVEPCRPLAQIEREELIHLLAQGIGELPRTEQTVLILYYKEGLFLKEIGALLEVSESRVSQLLSRAVQMLNIWLTDKTK
ncbi:MAG: sigma-70 family RNA polymerase sigma factor [Planctomycetota bacterium]